MSKELERIGKNLSVAQFTGSIATATIALLIFGASIACSQCSRYIEKQQKKVENVNKAKKTSVIAQKIR